LSEGTRSVPLNRFQTHEELTIQGLGTKRGFGLKGSPAIQSIAYLPDLQVVELVYKNRATTETAWIPTASIAAMWNSPPAPVE
jgi:hypothetical protein